MSFYTSTQRAMQERFEDTALANRLEQSIVCEELDDDHRAFIADRDFFFLSTVDEHGMPTVSHKGGPVGLVTIVDSRTLAFPTYDGNGMHLSVGNVLDTGNVGLLFIDLEMPRRVRVQGTATVSTDDPLIGIYPGAKAVVRVHLSHVFRNCGRYIHSHTRVESSKHVPAGDASQPIALWKRIDGLQDALGDDVNTAVANTGGTITADEYARRMRNGEA